MGSLSTFFSWSTPSTSDELPDIFPLNVIKSDFIRTDVVNIYSKILTDVLERTHGLSEDMQSTLFDNCLESEAEAGLITMLAEAMADKKDLFLVWEPGIKVLRRATGDEQNKIQEDYKAQGESKEGIYISFKKYRRSDMIKLYSGLEYCTVAALNKDINLAKAIQIKLKDLRGSTGLIDKEDVKKQAQSIAKGLGEGKDVLLDKEDMIETSNPDLNSIKESITFLNQKRSFYLGLPEAYINGIQTGGMGTSGENDTKAIERGLKNYYFSVVKPVLKALYGVDSKYKSQDFRMIDQALQALQTFSLVEDDLLSQDQKKAIINQLLDIDDDGGSDA